MTRLGQAVVAGLVLLSLLPAGASAAPACKQDDAARPSPTASITLEKLSGSGLTLSKGGLDTKTVAVVGGAIPRPGMSSAASVTQPQDTNYQSAAFRVLANAHVLEPGDRVQIRVCTEGGKLTDAGTFTGELTVFGPAFRPQTYSYTVTARYFWLIPALLLFFGGCVYVALMWANNRLPSVAQANATNKVIFALATLVGFCLAYFSVYQADKTWGDALLSDLSALFTGGVTVAGVVTGGMALLLKKEDAAAGGDAAPEDAAAKPAIKSARFARGTKKGSKV